MSLHHRVSTPSYMSVPRVVSTMTHPSPERDRGANPKVSLVNPTSSPDPNTSVAPLQSTIPASSEVKETSVLANGTYHLGHPTTMTNLLP